MYLIAVAKRPRERVIEYMYQQPAPKKFKHGEKNWYKDGNRLSVTDVKIKKVLKRDTNCAKIKEVPFWEVYCTCNEEKKLKI